MENKLARELLDFINQSPTAYHATETVKKMLSKAEFEQVKDEDNWKLKQGGKYFFIKDNSAIIAFIVGNGELEKDGFRIIGAHTDSPCFKIKPNPEIKVENHYLKLNTEAYGGMILSTWFDRPLSIAGRVTIKGKSIFKPEVRLVDINKPVLIIPNLAIHMNKNINEGYAINKQKDTLPLLGFINEKFQNEDLLLKILSDNIKVKKEDIIDFDLFLYEHEKGTLLGCSEEFISASRLDDLWMVFAGIKALINSTENKATKVMLCVDNEEIGSLTSSGADSSLIQNFLERISIALNKNREEYFRALSNTIMISADLAHGLHPNQVEKHDPSNRPLLGRGPVIKLAAAGSYSTNGYSSAIFKELCKRASVPYQSFVNRSDVRGGTTIGPILAAKLCIPVIDMGAALLSMHSIRELGATKDNKYIIDLFTTFFGENMH